MITDMLQFTILAEWLEAALVHTNGLEVGVGVSRTLLIVASISEAVPTVAAEEHGIACYYNY
jgi:hypothetical protein